MSTETLDDEMLHIRSIVLGGLEQHFGEALAPWKLEKAAHAITRALAGHFVRGAVASGTIEAVPSPVLTEITPAGRKAFNEDDWRTDPVVNAIK